MALARERDGDGQTEEDLKKAALITEGNKVGMVFFTVAVVIVVGLLLLLLLSLSDTICHCFLLLPSRSCN